jgi:hypothetical protein
MDCIKYGKMGVNMGRRPSFSAKTQVEDCKSLPISKVVEYTFAHAALIEAAARVAARAAPRPGGDRRFASRRAAFQPGAYGSLAWTRGEQKTGSISWRVAEKGVYLDYQITPPGGESVAYNYLVSLTYTWLVSGGRRMWWVCPLVGCGRRCAVLYLPPGARYFGCRRCYDLAYRSQQDRLATHDPWEGLARTSWGRKVLAEMAAERAALMPPPAPVVPPVKRPRGRPRTKRKYTRRTAHNENE